MRTLLCGRVAPHLIAFLIATLVTINAAKAQSTRGPQPAPLPPAVPSPVDTPYTGTIALVVDLTNLTNRVVDVRETIPVRNGEITLLYPEWIPGRHSASGPLENMAGLNVWASGKRLDWLRDRVNVHAFRIKVPKNETTIEINFQYLSPFTGDQTRFSSKIVDLSWNTVLLYPAGYFSRQIQFEPAIRLPENWKFATALEVTSQHKDLVQFKPVALNTLVDSPVLAGANYKRLDLSTGNSNQVYLDVFADTPSELEITPEILQYHRNLVIQAEKLFNSHHYAHYDFLVSLSDTLGFLGLEHHQSSEDSTQGSYFTDWDGNLIWRDILCHEYTHSWNGKFRRPADLWTPNFNVPMQNDLLWIYEGLTQYYGLVLEARSGMINPKQGRDFIAVIATNLDASPGRTWSSLEDTTNQLVISPTGAQMWPSWQRMWEYYTEGLLIWLDADITIRKLSDGKKSLDDFAKLFFGIENGSYLTESYNLPDIEAALNTVQPYDWRKFFQSRVYELALHAPEGGITEGGYRLVYNDDAPDWMKKDPPFGTMFDTSLGFRVKADGSLTDVQWNGLSFKAGITPDMQILGVNDQQFSISNLRQAIQDAEKSTEAIKLLLKRGNDFITVRLEYHDGFRYPHLDRVDAVSDRMDAILSPLK